MPSQAVRTAGDGLANTEEAVSTNPSMLTTAIDRDLVVRRSAGEPDWLREQRLAAWDEFVRLPVPPDAGEEWRRTDLRALDFDALRPLEGPTPP